MARRNFILLIFSLLFYNPFNFAQQKPSFTFRHIDQADGLLHTAVKAIVQDDKGYIWILTLNGLQRYDGTRFVNYPVEVNNPGRTTATRDLDLFSDRKNNSLWLMYHDAEKLDLQKNKFTLYTPEKFLQDSSLKFDTYKDVSGSSWLAGAFGFFYPTNEEKLAPYYLAVPGLSPNKSHLAFTDIATGDIWLADWSGLSLFEKKTQKKYTHDYNPGKHPLLQLMDKKNLTGIFKDSKENIWLSTGSNTFYKYNCVDKKLAVYSLAAIKGHSNINMHENHLLLVRCFFEDNHQTIWAGTANGGLLQYHREKDSFTCIQNEETNKLGLHYNYEINCIFQDKEENIWLGTDKGINIFNPYRQYFQAIRHEENNPNTSLPKNEITHFIQAANGNILAGTWGGGITIYDSSWNFIRQIYLPSPYEYNLVWSFVQNDDGSIWAGCQHGFIHLYDPSTGAIKTIHPPELHNQTIWTMVKDKRGNIWLGLHDGKIAKWDKRQNKFYAYNDSIKGIPQTFSNVVNIFFDSRQRCWVTTTGGFKAFDTQTLTYSGVYLADKKHDHSLSSNYCSGIEEYDDSTLLVGTVHGGLNFFDPGKKTFTHLTVKEGLPANTIHAIRKDAGGYVWFTTDYDLYKFKPADKKFIRLNIEAGTVNSEFSNVPFCPLQDGRWLAGTATELISFHTKNNVPVKKTGLKVEITRFTIFDSSILIDSLLAINQPVQLSYKQNFLTIEFALLNFSNLQQTNYYYRLTAVDKDWVNAANKRFASYTNLEPGEYIFSVKADNGHDTSPTATFNIIITPPFWNSLLFKLTCLLVAGLLISWLFKKRIQTVRKEAGMKQEIAETQMMALRAQMNPHFIFNCLNSIDNLIQEDEKEKATLYLAKFAKLIRSILENSKNKVVSCWKDIETLKLYLELEELRCDKKFSYKINIADEILNGDYKVPPLVIQPFVENAIHHGLLNKIDPDKKLTIDVIAGEHHIYYCIRDNGVGRVKAAAYKEINKPTHESMGMQITTERINLFNQNKNGSVKITDLVNEFNEPVGTKVEVELTNQS